MYASLINRQIHFELLNAYKFSAEQASWFSGTRRLNNGMTSKPLAERGGGHDRARGTFTHTHCVCFDVLYEYMQGRIYAVDAILRNVV
jgi:hypothetical protein